MAVEILILIAIVILGGASIKMLSEMRDGIDRQTKVDEEILKDVRAIHGTVNLMRNPAQLVQLETDISFIKDHTDGLRSDVYGVESAVKDMKNELKTELMIRLPVPPVDLGPQPG